MVYISTLLLAVFLLHFAKSVSSRCHVYSARCLIGLEHASCGGRRARGTAGECAVCKNQFVISRSRQVRVVTVHLCSAVDRCAMAQNKPDKATF